MVEYTTPLNRPSSHKAYDKAGKVRAVLRIALGYRNLINWSQTPVWAQSAEMSLADAEGPPQPGGPGGRGGPTRDPGEGSLVIDKRWAGSNKGAPLSQPGLSKRVPGDAGVAYGVSHPTVPSFRGGDAKIAAAFGMNTPQWLYRLAENLKWSGSMSLSELQKMDEGAFADRGIFDSGKSKDLSASEWRDALKAQGKETLSDKMWKSGKHKNLTVGELEKLYGKKGSVENPDYNIDEGANPFGMRDTMSVKRSLGPTQEESQWTNFPKFGSGGKNQHYTRTFSDKVYGNAVSSIQTQMNSFKAAVAQRQSDIMDNISFRQTLQEGGGGGTAAEKAPGEMKGGQMLVGGGQTSQEKLAEIVGIGHAPSEKQIIAGGTRRPDPESAPYGSKNIDISLKKQVKQDNDLAYSRVDITTDSYQSYKDHHGIGPKGGRTRTAFDSTKSAKKTVKKEQNSMIDKYNTMIKKLFTLYGTTDVHEIRKEIARKETHTTAKRGDLVKQFLGAASGALKDVTYPEMNEILSWVLHAMGNFLSSDRTWASAMGIKLNTGNGLLILTYNMSDDGTFMKLTEGDINIQEYSLEQWLFDLGVNTRTQATLEQAMSEANEAFAVTGLVQQSVEAGIFRSAYSVGGAAVTHLALPIPGYFSKRMDDITMEIISNISQGIETTLQSDMVSEATQFSRRMRQELSTTDIPDWMQGISDLFLGGVEIQRNPFWYLWTAPYLSSEYPQRGFGKQFNQ